jgi:hypothetical protein
MAGEPLPQLGLLVGAAVVEHDVDQLAGRHRPFDRIEEADALLVPVALHAAADHRAVEQVERREQRGRAVALVVVVIVPGALLHRQARLGPVERLDLALRRSTAPRHRPADAGSAEGTRRKSTNARAAAADARSW